MDIKIVDAIMGSGKTEAAIQYVKDNPQERFLFVTPYKKQIRRLRQEIGPDRIFAPICFSDVKIDYQNKGEDPVYIAPEYCPGIDQVKYATKWLHLKDLLCNKQSVATTHSLFMDHCKETLDLIVKNSYVLIVDQVLDVLMPALVSHDSVSYAINKGSLVKNGTNSYIWDDQEYDIPGLTPLQQCRGSRSLYVVSVPSRNGSAQHFFYWSAMCQAIAMAKQAFVLTYMFEYQDLKYYFDMNDISYRYYGVKQSFRDDGRKIFQFTALEHATTPSYVYHLKDTLILLEERNRGTPYYFMDSRERQSRGRSVSESGIPCSMSWFGRAARNPNSQAGRDLAQLKSVVEYFFRGQYGNASKVQERMWGTYQGLWVPNRNQRSGQDKPKNKKTSMSGAARLLWSNVNTKANFVVFNQRASNDYRNKTRLAYCANVYSNCNKTRIFTDAGLSFNEDGYATSIIVQWIWRSAIRDGKPVTVYIPSLRMRRLVQEWLNHPYIAKQRFASTEGGGRNDSLL